MNRSSEVARTLLGGRVNWTSWILSGGVVAVTLTVIIMVIRGGAESQLIVPGPPGVMPAPVPTSVDAGAVAAQLERRTLVETQLHALRHQGEQTRALLTEADMELARWTKIVEAALNNDQGRSVAVDPDAVDRFAAAYQIKRPGSNDIEVIRNQVARLLKPVDTYLANISAAIPPSDELGKSLAAQHEAADDIVATLRRSRQTCEAVIAAAPVSGKKGDRTLAEALAVAQQRRDQDFVDQLAQVKEKARHEGDKIIAEAQARLIQQGAERKVKEIESEIERKKKEAILAEERIIIQSEQDRLEALANDPAVQAKFQPFLAKGRNKVGIANNWRYEYPLPASFRLIQSSGCLASVQSFAAAGAGRHPVFQHNDRPRWTYPTTEAGFKDRAERL
jgi:hypothetical protein